MSPGQAAYTAMVTQAVIDGHGIGEYAAWEHLEPWQRERWEAAAHAVAALACGPECSWTEAFHDEATDLRALVAEILGHLDDAGIHVDDEIRTAWRERAGLEAVRA